ncbi:hypothetical protein T230_04895 [Tannerella sp. oral taxon BU063 isolate Cell 1/3]|uniref:Uncharacterized protein n=1 Tax=Tannerella sp. oral taxon BU063 isolate Cell 1/3 TaxID=1411022 RepID=W2CQI7_9BACT|nr:hypothetical protein T230_04895 [Tannerella sp. oral taxon BU063 isolate Cell 1/3]
MFHRKQYDLVKAIDNTKLKLPANLMPNWYKGIEAEGDLSRESTFSRHTAELLKKDEERDEQLESIFFIVRGNKLSSVSANREAAKRIDEKLRAYYSDTRKAPYDKESSLILGIKKDMAGFSADIATLGLTASFTQLYTINDEYIELQKTRSLAGADSQLPPASVVRPLTDAAFNIVCQYILSAYLNATTEDDKALFDQLVDRMNKISRETRATQRQMQAQRKPKDPKEPKQPKDPKDPKKPDQPKDPKKPDKPEQPQPPKEGGDGNPDIHLPEE